MNHSVLNIQDSNNLVFLIRGCHVMIDRDLAIMYGVEVKRLNEQVKRNSERFPKRFRFQLTDDEKLKLVANCDRFEKLKYSSTNPYVFTEQGVAMLSAVLRSKTAISVSLRIMNLFVEYRKILIDNSLIFNKLSTLETELETLRRECDFRFEHLFEKLNSLDYYPQRGIFYDGQLYDAYNLISTILSAAKETVYIIDNYVDESIFSLLTKCRSGIRIRIYSKGNLSRLHKELEIFKTQYPFQIEIHSFLKSHDRFIVIDEVDIYHIGASIKDLGKKWFAFSKMKIDLELFLKQLE
jgi:hypothetical protein